MTADAKTEDTKPTTTDKKKLALELGEGIPLKELRFKAPGAGTGVDLPGKTGANAVRAGDGSEGSYELTYFPRSRHHRVVFTPRGEPRTVRTVFVHETWCSWEPD